MKPQNIKAIAKSIGMLCTGLETYGKPYSTDLVKSYTIALDDTKFEPEDVERATKWFLQESDGKLPSTPEFKRKVEYFYSKRFKTIGVDLTDGSVFLASVPAELSIEEARALAERQVQEALRAGRLQLRKAALTARNAAPSSLQTEGSSSVQEGSWCVDEQLAEAPDCPAESSDGPFEHESD